MKQRTRLNILSRIYFEREIEMSL